MINSKSWLKMPLALAVSAWMMGGVFSAQAAESSQDKYTKSLKVGYIVSVDTEVDKGAKKFKEILESSTDGRVKVNLFPNAQLGGEVDMLKGLKEGVIDVVIAGDGILAPFLPKYQGLVLPFLIKDFGHMDRVYGGEVGKEINDVLMQKVEGRVLGYWHRGPKSLTANKLIKEPKDLEGLKLRTVPTPLVVAAWKALGASTTPMNFEELFVALQLKTVDAQDNPLDLIYSANFYEVQKYVILTKDTYTPWAFIVSDRLYQKFPEDVRAKFDEAFKAAGKYQNELVDQSDELYVRKLKEKGMEFIEPDRALFQSRLSASGVMDEFKDKLAPGLFEKIKALESK
ncbi:MAG: TRAP transporter substrate-binding protein [Castellaniella sp.]|uniref:TRAP transporter substrate-binding protein n=1 Tax=Castellaniella hirudinis TaxID=1144617 RepID=A0ABV8RVW6_9BURK